MKKVNQQYYTPLFANLTDRPEIRRRERNYCYELYHQMRINPCLMKKIKENNYIFNSEIDKGGHPIIKENINPDFILHRQGQMGNEDDDNFLVIEVKSELNSNSYHGIAKDIKNLSKMTNEYDYRHGMFILINFSLEELKKKIRFITNKSEYLEIKEDWKKTFSKVDIICSKKENEIDEIITLKKLVEVIDP